jgi:hypothetical protein
MTGDVTDIASSVSSIVKFLELSGRNYLLVTKGKPVDKSSVTTSLFTYLSNSKLFEDFEDFKNLLSNKSVLFRVDLIVFDFWHLSKDLIIFYKKEIDKLQIDHIIVAKEYYYKSTEDVSDYHLRREMKNNWGLMSPTDTMSQVVVYDNINKWTSNLDDLVKSYIRDKKIDNIFGESND